MDSVKQLELAVGQVVALAEQIITLSSAILVLSVTFAKDVVKFPKAQDRVLLSGAWTGYLLAIVAGIWVRMAVTGTLLASRKFGEFNVQFPAALQVVLFLVATSLFLWLAIRGISRTSADPSTTPDGG